LPARGQFLDPLATVGSVYIDGVEQLTRYLDVLNRGPHLAPVSGVFAAQQIKPQAHTLATDRGIRCVTVDYDELRGLRATT
jgi:endonuclease